MPTVPEGVTVEVDPNAPAEGRASLKVTYTGTEPVSVTLFEVDDLGVEDCTIFYQARIRSKDIEGQAYIEMLCAFGGGEYFSRALEQAVSGTTDWRASHTPFFLKEGQSPERVRLGVRFEGSGIVWVDAVRLSRGMPGANGARWGYVGAAMGILAAIWGPLAGTWAPRGRGRGLVIGMGAALLGCSLVLLARGVMLLVSGAGYDAYHGWLMTGGIGTLVFGPLLPVVRKRYREAEARRMAAMDMAEAEHPVDEER
ncbi:MAG TPA: hypothetical protein ENN80_07225 [Candidatus Hydrogenedentes bacterium]|nr:hypothetical protein [Candidatus Hydrogenedentota bacterium]